MPAILALGAECGVVGVPDGCVHDPVVHGEGCFATEGVLLSQAHFAVAPCRRPVVVACGQADLGAAKTLPSPIDVTGEMRGMEAEVWH